jgi:hypothetical protein
MLLTYLILKFSWFIPVRYLGYYSATSSLGIFLIGVSLLLFIDDSSSNSTWFFFSTYSASIGNFFSTKSSFINPIFVSFSSTSFTSLMMVSYFSPISLGWVKEVYSFGKSFPFSTIQGCFKLSSAVILYLGSGCRSLWRNSKAPSEHLFLHLLIWSSLIIGKFSSFFSLLGISLSNLKVTKQFYKIQRRHPILYTSTFGEYSFLENTSGAKTIWDKNLPA